MKGRFSDLRTGLSPASHRVQGEFFTWEGQPWYQIRHYDQMPPFFFSVVSAEDHWMFLSSQGGLTAGRKDAEHALFPYLTDDKIRDSAEVTGGKTLLRVSRAGQATLWEPLCCRGEGRFRVQRTLAKCLWGHQVFFEEENLDLGLVFRTGWFSSRKYGWIRRSWLKNVGRKPARVEYLDGIQNLLPAGVGSEFQLRFSTLLDAYKRNELVAGSGLALFRLSAVPADRPEPAESLSTTVAWSVPPKGSRILLSSRQLEIFRSGRGVEGEKDVCGQRGAYMLSGKIRLGPEEETEWMIGADVFLSAAEVVDLRNQLRQPRQFREKVLADIREGTGELRRLVGSADGLQVSALPMGMARHTSNVLCNIMRGGVFLGGQRVERRDLDRFVASSAPASLARWRSWSKTLPEPLSFPELIRRLEAGGDPGLERVGREYLPLTFSRRHGDPSRPWNRFTIPRRDASGDRILNYEGNWRDLFQNWEALAQSFPGFLPGMISRFLNASTADGYNPYRITRHGIDWEVPEPHDPWACIGYWGDHQIIYLLKLLEHALRHCPQQMESLLGREVFAYANVPYRIRGYRQLVDHPKDTVVFDHALEKTIQSRVRVRGGEGKLLWDREGRVIHANLAEKLLVPLLAKLSNFVPEAGIWLNTQRPEWNDANNALVGQGASVVTLAYLRRYLAFLVTFFSSSPRPSLYLARDLEKFLEGLAQVFGRNRKLLARGISDQERRRVLDLLGQQGEIHRHAVYRRGPAIQKRAVSKAKILCFLRDALAWVDHSLKKNRRKDGLYHSYNLLSFLGKKGIGLRRLYEMLEGQVAVLSSGLLSPDEAVVLLRALRRSAMYRGDQHSYLLYPNRPLPRFLERNNLPASGLRRGGLLHKLLAEGDRQVVERDAQGQVHFRPGLANQRELQGVLDRLAQNRTYRSLVRRDRAQILRIYEEIFDHQSFTGRSGTFYGYEGLGCIYWHMVSKLLLAVQELCFQAENCGSAPGVRRALARAYYDIRRGLGDAKRPEEYGAFPMDPYSHTPAHAGAKQPGLTGQVKEDILCRLGELGVVVEGGRIFLRPVLLRRKEFPRQAGAFAYFDTEGCERRMELPEKSLAFTVCQTPFIYRLGREAGLTVCWQDGFRSVSKQMNLDGAASRAVLQRSGLVRSVEATLNPANLLADTS